jgi:serine/threonine protein kinase
MSAAMPGYRLRRLIQRGRCYEVFDAWSDERDSPVVIKRARPGADPASGRILVREGRRLLTLTHPHLVRAYEVYLQPRPAIVLETLPGQTLGHLFHERGPLPPADVVQLGRQMVSVLSYLHTKNLVHADVKPENATVSDGLVKVIDLSLAQAPGRWRRRAGTPGYLAPEQARAGIVTAATDVWGLGLVLLEAACGEDPYPVGCAEYEEGVGPSHSPLSLRQRRRTPRALSDLLDEMTQIDPSRRPPMTLVRSELLALPARG